MGIYASSLRFGARPVVPEPVFLRYTRGEKETRIPAEIWKLEPGDEHIATSLRKYWGKSEPLLRRDSAFSAANFNLDAYDMNLYLLTVEGRPLAMMDAETDESGETLYLHTAMSAPWNRGKDRQFPSEGRFHQTVAALLYGVLQENGVSRLQWYPLNRQVRGYYRNLCQELIGKKPRWNIFTRFLTLSEKNTERLQQALSLRLTNPPANAHSRTERQMKSDLAAIPAYDALKPAE